MPNAECEKSLSLSSRRLPPTLIDMCLCVYGQRGVLNLQPHIKMLQWKMAALVQLRPQPTANHRENRGSNKKAENQKTSKCEL